MSFIKTLLKGFLAGIAISFGGWLCLKTNIVSENNVLGSFLFAFGLILICNFDFYLYTGKVCYLFDKKEEKYSKRIIDLLIILGGNLLGTLFFSSLLRFVLQDNDTNNLLMTNLISSVTGKINYSWYQMIGLSFFCGALVYIAVEGFKKIDNMFGKYVVLFLAIGGFIISGFEHSIANMFYYFLSGNYGINALLSLLLCVIGNSLGGLFIPLINKIINYNKKNEEK